MSPELVGALPYSWGSQVASARLSSIISKATIMASGCWQTRGCCQQHWQPPSLSDSGPGPSQPSSGSHSMNVTALSDRDRASPRAPQWTSAGQCRSHSWRVTGPQTVTRNLIAHTTVVKAMAAAAGGLPGSVLKGVFAFRGRLFCSGHGRRRGTALAEARCVPRPFPSGCRIG